MRTAVLVLLTLAAHAADLSGFWLGTFTGGRRPTTTDFAFQFVQNGNVLTGKQYLDYGSTPILKGTVDGDQISFEVLAREQNGNEISHAIIKFTGTLKDGEIEITRERAESRTAGNAGASFARPGKQIFKLKRLP